MVASDDDNLCVLCTNMKLHRSLQSECPIWDCSCSQKRFLEAAFEIGGNRQLVLSLLFYRCCLSNSAIYSFILYAGSIQYTYSKMESFAFEKIVYYHVFY